MASEAYATAASRCQFMYTWHTHTHIAHRQHCVKIKCLQTHVIPHTYRRMHADEYMHSCTHMHTAPISFIIACLCHDEYTIPSPLPLYLQILNEWPLGQMEMQAVKIASIASIVKRPSPDESQPKWVLLPGRAALLSFVSRGRLECLCLLCLSVFFSPLKNITDFPTLCLAFLGVGASLLCQRPVVQKRKEKKTRLRMPGMKCSLHLSPCHLSVLWLHVRIGESKTDRGVATGQSDFNHYALFYTF